MTPLEQQVREALTDEVIDDIHRTLDTHQDWASVRRQILTALGPLLEQQAAEVTDWIFVADGVTHDWRCKNNEATGGVKGGNFICLRCQVATLTAERDEARETAQRLRERNR